MAKGERQYACGLLHAVQALKRIMPEPAAAPAAPPPQRPEPRPAAIPSDPRFWPKGRKLPEGV